MVCVIYVVVVTPFWQKEIMETCFFALKLLLWGLANLHFEGVSVKTWSLHWTSFAWSLLREPRKPSPGASNCKPFAPLRQTAKVGWVFFGKLKGFKVSIWIIYGTFIFDQIHRNPYCSKDVSSKRLEIEKHPSWGAEEDWLWCKTGHFDNTD